MLEPCTRCGGKVMIDRAYCNFGHVELSCIICGKRWEYHRTHPWAKFINKIEAKRNRAKNGIGA
jgi:hypothetical protein